MYVLNNVISRLVQLSLSSTVASLHISAAGSKVVTSQGLIFEHLVPWRFIRMDFMAENLMGNTETNNFLLEG